MQGRHALVGIQVHADAAVSDKNSRFFTRFPICGCSKNCAAAMSFNFSKASGSASISTQNVGASRSMSFMRSRTPTAPANTRRGKALSFNRISPQEPSAATSSIFRLTRDDESISDAAPTSHRVSATDAPTPHSAEHVTHANSTDQTITRNKSVNVLDERASQGRIERKQTGKRDSCDDSDSDPPSDLYTNKDNKERLVQTSGRMTGLHRVNAAGTLQHSDTQIFYFETQKKLAARREYISKLQLDTAELHYDCVTTATPDVEDKLLSYDFGDSTLKDKSLPCEDSDNDKQMQD